MKSPTSDLIKKAVVISTPLHSDNAETISISLELLTKVSNIVRDKGFENADINSVIVAQFSKNLLIKSLAISHTSKFPLLWFIASVIF